MENLRLRSVRAAHEMQLNYFFITFADRLPELLVFNYFEYFGRIMHSRPLYVNRAAYLVDAVVAARVVGLQLLPLREVYALIENNIHE